MKINDPAGTDWEPASAHRTPDLRIKKLLQDASDREFEFNLTEFSSDSFFSPRHRHNFDQFRIQLDGVSTYGEDPDLEPGLVAYYPEGTYYGPLGVRKGPTLQAIIQFGGASGCEYVNYKRLDAATAELRKEGTFERGVFKRVHEDGTHENTDGYQASWERATGTGMHYPSPRFITPVYADHRNFPWQPSETKGVLTKHLFTISESRTGVGALRLEPGATHTLDGTPQPAVLLTIEGGFETGGATFGQYSAMLVEDGDKVTLSSEQGVTMVNLLLPLK